MLKKLKTWNKFSEGYSVPSQTSNKEFFEKNNMFNYVLNTPFYFEMRVVTLKKVQATLAVFLRWSLRKLSEFREYSKKNMHSRE